MNKYDFILIDEHSNKLFHMPTVASTKASVKSKMLHNLGEPEIIVDMDPDLRHNSLMSATKFMDENYITVLTPEELLFYDGNEVKLQAPGQSILTVWRCKTSGLWRVPLKLKVENENVDNMLLKQPDPRKSTNNVYGLPSLEQVIKYPHVCTVFPTKEAWIETIRLGRYTTWTGLTIKPEKNYFPEAEGNQKIHMR